MPHVLLVMLGGALGAGARYGVGLASARWAGLVPAGTWIVNGLGCLLIGLAIPLLVDPAHPRRLLWVTGFLGAFTTFSAYSLETVALWEAGRPGLAALNAVGSVVVGLGAVLVGLAVGRWLAG